MHVTRSQLSAFTSFFEPQVVFFKALIADIHNMQPILPCELAEDDQVHLDGLPHLNRQVCLKCLEHGAGAQKRDQLILDLFQLAVDPTVDLPVVIDQAVLLQEVIGILVFGHLARVVLPWLMRSR